MAGRRLYPRTLGRLAGRGGRVAYKWELACEELRRRIRELELAPGAFLDAARIAAELGISRSPMRVAITQLAGDGLVEVVPHHGSYVAAIRAHHVREHLLIRMALEVEGARRAAGRADLDLAARLAGNLADQQAALARGDVGGGLRLGEAFHHLIFAAVAGPRSVRQLEASRTCVARAIRTEELAPARAEAALNERRRIADAIARGEPVLAAAAMRAHLAMSEIRCWSLFGSKLL